jgi:tRNA dimethylallyltransferase
MNKKKLIVIAGPTASGKTITAIKIAQFLNTEIISADSRQCYQELNIGVARPSISELNLIPHHFINCISIHQQFNAGNYEKYALQCLDEIFNKNNFAVCVGGTGLYIKALCQGIDTMPMIDEKINQLIIQQYQLNGLSWLQNEIKIADPEFYKKGELQNPHRLIRALVFIKSHHQSILSFQTQQKIVRNFDIEYYVIKTDKENLYQQINRRVDTMMELGLAQEVQNLIPFQTLNSLNTVGYKELFKYFNNECALQESIDKIKQHSRNYAKRQITWFKKLYPNSFLNTQEIFAAILQKYTTK